jgi:NADH-quinone oxidoreductase subunit N
MGANIMNATLTLNDLCAMSPLLILLVATLLVLIIESASSHVARRVSLPITIGALLLGLSISCQTPPGPDSLLTPWLRFDALSHTFATLFLGIGIVAALLSAAFFERFPATHGEYYFLLLSALFGLVLIGFAADFLTLFLGIETLSISLYVLCGYMKSWSRSHEASMKYFILGSLAAAILLYGIALIYGAVGTTRLDALASAYQGLVAESDRALFLAGVALVTLGLAFEAAIVPFHLWAPDVYDGAPTPVTAFMAVGTKVGAFVALTRVFLIALPDFDPRWNQGVALLAYPTLILANLIAIRQDFLRRFFAYSGISHAGFLLLPFAAGGPDALPALLFYLVVYGFATFGCFAILAFLDRTSSGVQLHDLQGLFKRAPGLATLLTLCLLTLAGIPPTVGFFAKLNIFKVALQAGYYGLVTVGLLTTIVSAYYYLRMVMVMLGEAPDAAVTVERSWFATIAGVLVGVAIVGLSIYPAPLLAWLQQ